MSTWNQIREEFTNAQHKDIRMKYAKAVTRITQRNLVIYASEFTSGSRPSQLTSLLPDDKIFFGDAIRGLDPKKGIDVLVESPGGVAEVAEAIAKMLWSTFSSVRFIVPNMAKSAATLLVLSGEKIIMDEQSELGPIDPQMPVRQPNDEIRYSPAHLIIQQFQTLLGTVAQHPIVGQRLAPFLQIYFPSLIQECRNAIELSKKISKELLQNYMFKGVGDAESKADKISNELGEFKNFLSHGRAINIEEAKALGLEIYDLREDSKLRNAINRLFFSIKETFNRNQGMIKICENCQGHGTVLQMQVGIIPPPLPPS